MCSLTYDVSVLVSNLTSGGKSGMCHAVYLPHHKFQFCAMLGNCFNKTAKVWCSATLDHDATDRAPSHESSHQARRFPGSMQPLIFKTTVSSAHYWGTILAYANVACVVMCSVEFYNTTPLTSVPASSHSQTCYLAERALEIIRARRYSLWQNSGHITCDVLKNYFNHSCESICFPITYRVEYWSLFQG